MKNKLVTISIILGATLFLLLLVSGIYSTIRPYDNQITQDRPFVKFMCGLQADCKPYVGKYTCGSNFVDIHSPVLEKWSQYRGCNVSTFGFGINDGGYMWITVEYCSCGGIFS